MINISNDLLKKAILKNVKEYLYNNFQHIFMPPCVYGKITKVSGRMVNLKILDNNKNEDETFQELPNIYTDINCIVDDVVILNFINGEIESPVIIRKVG